MKRTTLLWVLFLVPIGLLLATAFVLEREVAKSKATYETIKTQLVAKGENLNLSEITPKRNPDGERKALALIAACEELNRQFKAENVPRLNLVQTPNASGEIAPVHARETPLISGTPNLKITWEEAESAHKVLAPQLQRVRELARQPGIEIHPAYHEGVQTEKTGMNEIDSAVNPLASDGYFALRNRDSGRVVADIEALLSLSGVIQKQRFLINGIVAASIQEKAWHLTWALLVAKICSSDDLEKLHQVWIQANLLESLATILRVERSASMQLLENSPPEEMFKNVEGDSFDVPALKHAPEPLQYFLWRTFFRYEDLGAYLLGYQALIEAALRSQATGRWSDLLSAKTGTPKAFCPVSNLVLPNILPGPRKLVLTQVLANMTLVVIALEQYALIHGTYPETLSALEPEYLAELPRDPIDNQPLRYKKNSDNTFQLYSIGIDGADNSGDATAPKGSRGIVIDRKDIVWPGIAAPEKETSKPRIVPKKFVRRLATPSPTPDQRSPQSTP